MDLWQIPPYETWTLSVYLVHALWGFIGALVRISYRNSPIKLPSKDQDGSIKLNALGTIFVGTVFGMLIDNGPMYSTVGSIIAPEAIEALLEVSRIGVRAWASRKVNEFSD